MKGDNINKAEEFLYKLSLQPKFAEFLTTFRDNSGIILDGSVKNEQWQDKWNSLINNPEIAFRILVYSELAQRKFKIPISYAPFIRLYMCLGYIPKELNEVEPAKICPPPFMLKNGETDEEKEIKKFYSKEPYVKLLIFGTSTKSDIIKYIKNNWDKIEKILEQQGCKPKGRIRQSPKKKRNYYIKRLWEKPLKELQEMANSKNNYKDLLIQKILKNDGYGEVNEGYIRSLNSNK